MTFREKLAKEHPNKTEYKYCPYELGYEEKYDCKGVICLDCWGREIPATKSEETPTLPTDTEAYNKGLQDAWELALKYIKMGVTERKKVFHIHDCESFFGIIAPQEALAKLKAYEEEQEQIKVGDVVQICGLNKTYVVTTIDTDRGNKYYCGIGEKGTWFFQRDVVKTGKHIDVNALLEQIRGE